MNFNRWKITIFAAIVVGAVGIRLAEAKELKPSELVTLSTDFGAPQAPCSGSEYPIRSVRNPDGTVTPLVIPEGKVLVLTAGSWVGGGVVLGNASYHLTLFYKTSSTTAGVFTGAGALSDSAGEISGSFNLGSGLVLKQGTTLCAVLDSNAAGEHVAFVYVNGFFAKDK